MWHNTRRGFNLIRNRANARVNIRLKTQLHILLIAFILVSAVSVFAIFAITNKNNVQTVKNTAEEVAQKDVDIYKEVADKDVNANQDNEIKEENSLQNVLDTESEKDVNKTQRDGIKITALGEIMMGGNNFSKNNYSLAFKQISQYLQDTDYVVSTLATNITSVEDLSDTKSKYIVNESISNAFVALNISGINIATDHMLDFSKNMFDNTVNVLRKNKIDVIGMDNDIAYAENNGIRVAFIGINNVIIGNTKNYIDAGMYVYDLNKVKENIKEAKENADLVVVMPHYGKENSNQVTDVMRWFSRELINAGADVVLGGHSLGIYPPEEYNGKIIIYSLGYLMHDTNNEIGKKSAIFDFNINKEGKIEQIDITPTYIENKNTVKLYKEINQGENTKFIEELNKNSKLTNYTSKIENDKLVIVKK